MRVIVPTFPANGPPRMRAFGKRVYTASGDRFTETRPNRGQVAHAERTLPFGTLY